MSDVVCPNCRVQTTIAHTWRVDMARLRTIDDFKCLTCGEHWQTHSTVNSAVSR